jgi:hypothetical protein
MSIPSYYGKIVANTYNDNIITVKTLKSKFNATTSPILQQDERYKTEPKERAFAMNHLKESQVDVYKVKYI